MGKEDYRMISYGRLVRAAWDAVPEDYEELISTMPNRCQAIINAEGGHILY